jgi:hypothetical protein
LRYILCDGPVHSVHSHWYGCCVAVACAAPCHDVQPHVEEVLDNHGLALACSVDDGLALACSLDDGLELALALALEQLADSHMGIGGDSSKVPHEHIVLGDNLVQHFVEAVEAGGEAATLVVGEDSKDEKQQDLQEEGPMDWEPEQPEHHSGEESLAVEYFLVVLFVECGVLMEMSFAVHAASDHAHVGSDGHAQECVVEI